MSEAPARQASPALYEVRRLSKSYLWRHPSRPWKSTRLSALDRVDLTVESGECLAIVGESGSGKTTLAQCMVRLLEPDAGDLIFLGHDLRALSAAQLKPLRAQFQMIFQDAAAAFNPRLRIRSSLAEPFLLHRLAGRDEVAERVGELLQEVGLPASVAERYPHQLSGGQRQRLGIVRGLATRPRLLLLDEPVSALDVSVRAQILSWLVELQRRYDLTTVIIAHDLAMVETIATRVAVFYFGRLVELASCRRLFAHPQHPYTVGLLRAVPRLDPAVRRPRSVGLRGEIPSPLAPPSGCAFHPRCPLAQERCRRQRPELRDLGSGHRAACHFPGEWSTEMDRDLAERTDR